MSKTLKGLQALLCLAISLNAVAQRDTTRNFIMGGYYTLPIEVPRIDNNGMVAELKAAGYPAPPAPSVVPGFGFQWHLDHGIVNFAYLSGSRREKTDTSFARHRYRSFEFNVGYDVLHTVHYSLYPYLGFKTCAVNYKFYEMLADSTPALQQYLGTTLDHKEISNSRLHLDLGIGFAFRHFFLINLRAGYLVPLQKSEWFINASKTTVVGGPDTRFGTYFTVSIGLGTISDDKTNRERAERRRQANEQRNMGIVRAAATVN